ncbi:MAG: PP2C family protein-serine/threonine phosphatase [Lachnospiraceae bacterium]|nr:PP2C family protein-serine/threonine phosphatase [Lachnospiraceae bacterium]
MEFVGKNEKRRALAASIAYAFLIILCGLFLWMRGLDTLTQPSVFNISADIYGMLVGYVLYICYLIDVEKTGSGNRYFVCLLNVAYFGMFTDACAWLLNGIPSLRIFNLIDNMFYYMCTPIGACFLWLYIVVYVLKLQGKLISVLNLIVKIGLGVALFIRFISLFTGLYFTVDEAGEYRRGTFFPLSLVYSIAVMLLTLLVAFFERKKLETYKLVALAVYVLAPTTVGTLTAITYGISITFCTVMLIMLLMYCVLNITQGRAKAIADRDLTVASAIQQNMLPRIFPPYPERAEFDLYASMTPAKEVGGDFYDFFLVDDDHLALVIADVSGKGVPAALFMMVSKALIKNRLQAGDSPGVAISNVNDMLAHGNTNSMFVTVWCSVLEISTGRMTVVNAGHEHPAIRRSGGEYELSIYDHNPMVGMMEELPFDEHEVILQPGDNVFVYTDGVPEAQNMSGQMFEPEGMLKALNSAHDSGPEAIIGKVMDSIIAFRGDALQFDDITMLCIRYNGGK